jgi:hypothetical protein
MFAHCVYFWLEDDCSDDEIQQFEDGLRMLVGMDLVNDSFVGVPANTPREVVDNSYDYALFLWFDDKETQDAYQGHATHKKFVRDCKPLWKRVQVYDSTTAGL